MLIALKQSEIEKALAQYISQQGINTQGKTITVDFSMGRKGAGLSAEIDIEEGAVQQPPVPTLSVVQAGVEVIGTTVDAVLVDEVPVDPAPVPTKSVSSLFG